MNSIWQRILSFGSANVSQQESTAERLYQLSLSHSRNPQLFADFGVEDSLDGRFDSLCLSMAVTLNRLAHCEAAFQEQAKQLSQQVFDIFCADMDLTLREMGVGDLGVAKRVKAMSEAFLGRLKAYREALEKEDLDSLEEALRRNLYRQKHEAGAKELAQAVHNCVSHLAAQKDDHICTTKIDLIPFSLSQ